MWLPRGTESFSAGLCSPRRENGVASSGSNYQVLNTRQCMLVAQLCQTLCDPMDCNPPSSSVHGIFQARILEWVAISFSRASSQPMIEPGSPALQADSLTAEPPRKPYKAEKFVVNVVAIAHPIECLVSPF